MPWCPNCKTEYKEGISKCADCGADLVEDLEETTQAAVFYGEEEQLKRFLGFLEYNGIHSGRISPDEERGQLAVFIDRELETRVARLGTVFLSGEAAREKKAADSRSNPSEDEYKAREPGQGTANIDVNNPDNDWPDKGTKAVQGMGAADRDMEAEARDEDSAEKKEEGPEDGADDLSETEALELMYEKKKKAGPYEKQEEKAKNFISSAYVLLPIGILGLAVMALCFMGVIDLPFAGQTKYMTYGVMTFLFAVFVATGISSYLSGKKFEKAAAKENDLENEIHRWFTETYPKDMLDEEVPHSGEKEEVLYFRRCEWMRERLMPRYSEAEDGLLEAVIDSVYQEYYGE